MGLSCIVFAETRPPRTMRIVTMSASSLVLKWDSGVDHGLRRGQHVTVKAEIDGQRITAEGLIARTDHLCGNQSFSLSDVKWYSGDRR